MCVLLIILKGGNMSMILQFISHPKINLATSNIRMWFRP
jgi:hypothetical protein